MPIYKTNKKKDGLTAYRVRVAYVDADGKHRQIERTVYGAAEARAEEVKIRVQLEKKETATKRMTVKQLFDEFMTVKSSEVRASTAYNRTCQYKAHIAPYIGSVSISALTPSYLQKNWKNALMGENIANSTRRASYIFLSTLLNYAVKMEYISNNPLKRLGNFAEPLKIQTAEKICYYTPEQFKLFAEAALEVVGKSYHKYQYYVFFMTAYFTGARMGEILALRWSDIQDNVLHIRRSRAPLGAETAPKTKSSIRDILMPLPLISILEVNKAKQQKITGFNTDFRIVGGASSPIRNTLRVFLRECAEKAGLPQITVHDFRHSHASLLANSGINIQEIARRLGHADVKITWNTYSHLYPKEEERAVSILNSIKV